MDVHHAIHSPLVVLALIATLNYAALPPSNALVLRKDWMTMIPREPCRLDVVFYSVGTYKIVRPLGGYHVLLWCDALKGHQVGPGQHVGMNRL